MLCRRGHLERDAAEHAAAELVEQDARHALGVDLAAAQQEAAPLSGLLEQLVAEKIAFLLGNGDAVAVDDGLRRLYAEQLHQLAAERLDIQNIVLDRARAGEQDADALVETFEVLERDFGRYFRTLKWLNLGGGHHITRPGYDIDALEGLIGYIRSEYGLTVYLEPGEAVALNAGFLVTEVLDVVENGKPVLILDASAACHMPDVLEMPYRPPLRGAGLPDEKPYAYRLAARTCLAGDVIGDYSFDRPIAVGDRLVFEDMAIYTMVKNNTFNGMPLPAIALLRENGEADLLKTFGYADFKGRLS